jgi:16S rRNA (cytosine1402-N4)-methyltransferase
MNAVACWFGSRLPPSCFPEAGRSVEKVVVELNAHHEPVMLEEVLQLLPLRPGGVAVDGTLGLGGHALEMALKIAPEGTIIGLDWDATMLDQGRRRIESVPHVTAHAIHSDYRDLAVHLDRLGLKADGILLDLGLNSAQIGDPERGIAFREEGPLDMRMDRSSGEPASALLNRLSANEIENILHDNADERWARAIAKAIVARRKERPLRTTQDLVDCVLGAIPPKARDKRIHPATRTFQAIRIAVNRELEGLEEAMEDAASALKPGGVMVVLSYHSGEDRAVKAAFRKLAKEGFEEITRKPMLPTSQEIQRNGRSRSAKLRAIRRTEASREV